MTYTRQVARYHTNIAVQGGKVESYGIPVVVPGPHTYLGTMASDISDDHDAIYARLIMVFLIDHQELHRSRSTVISMHLGLPDEEIRPAAQYLGAVKVSDHLICLFEEAV